MDLGKSDQALYNANTIYDLEKPSVMAGGSASGLGGADVILSPDYQGVQLSYGTNKGIDMHVSVPATVTLKPRG